jgi:hypothetical protein
MPVYGVDIHGTYQRGMDFSMLARQGYSFAAVKASQGVTEFNSSFTQQFLDWIPRIRAAGMIPGAYHWLTNADPVAQCRNFWRRLRQVGGPAGMLIQCDCEDNATIEVLRGWTAEWKRLSGGHPFLIYSGGWWWKPRGWNGAQFTPYLWQSHYLPADADTAPDDPAAFARRIPDSWWNPGYGGWARATILQFTSRGDAGSLGNNVDLNVYPGTVAQLRALAGVPQSSTPPATASQRRPTMILGKLKSDPAVYVGNGIDRRHLLDGGALQALLDAGVPMREFPAEATLFETVGRIDVTNGRPTPVALTPEDRAAIVADLAAVLRTVVDEELDEQSRAGADAD